MRPILLLTLAPLLAFAEAPDKKGDSCTIEAGPNDVVRRSGDVVVAAGQQLEQVIALDGQVTIKKGAKVRTVMAARGDVTIEGEVTETAISVGGRVRVQPGGVLGGGKVELTRGVLSLKGKSGDGFKGDLTIDGKSLSTMMLTGLLGKLDGCLVKEKE